MPFTSSALFRSLCVRLVACCVLAATPFAARALPEAELRASQVAGSWLEQIDTGHYADAWASCAPIFRDHIGRAEWVKLLEQARSPLGKVERRTVKRLFFTQDLPDAPPANYVVVEFETHFEGRDLPVAEILTPVLVGADGSLLQPLSQLAEGIDASWQVCGYYIKPQDASVIPLPPSQSGEPLPAETSDTGGATIAPSGTKTGAATAPAVDAPAAPMVRPPVF